jgi:hypothetical protein
MIAIAAVLITLGVIVFTLAVRGKDLPEPAPASPTAHLEERKTAIYENLRDLQFEYRVGKLSDHDYQQTKLDLQKELAGVVAEIGRITGVPAAPKASAPKPASAPAPAAVATVAPAAIRCPNCGATFPQPMKFCGECGSPMTEGA